MAINSVAKARNIIRARTYAFIKFIVLFQAEQNGTNHNGVVKTGKMKTGVCFPGQNGLYEPTKQMNGSAKPISNGYSSTDLNGTLRNRTNIANGTKD